MSWRFWLSDKTVRKFEELSIYRQRQNCSPGNLSFLAMYGYLRGFAGEGASNECEGNVNGDFRFFRSLYLPNLHTHGHNYYIVLCRPLVALHLHRNRWPWMTLNGHFAVKSCSSSTSIVLAFLAFGKNCSEICGATHRLSAAKNAAPLYWWYKCYRVIHWCSPKRKRQTSGLYSHSQFSDMLFTDIENK